MMDPTAFRAAFPRQLGYWTQHCLLNALPSLSIALGWMGLIKSPAAIAAIFSAIATFILLYAVLTSLKGPLAEAGHIFSRSLRLGVRIRAWIAGVSVLLLPLPTLTPDFWCGAWAVRGVDATSRCLGYGNAILRETGEPSMAGFLPIYAATLLEGILLSFLLLMISFFALMFVQAKERGNAFPRPA